MLKVRFLTSQMPILSGRINFIPHLTTSKKNFLRIPGKYSKNGQKFAMSKNVSNMLFETCWTSCKKPHSSTRSRSWYTFFWMTRYASKEASKQALDSMRLVKKSKLSWYFALRNATIVPQFSSWIFTLRRHFILLKIDETKPIEVT